MFAIACSNHKEGVSLGLPESWSKKNLIMQGLY